MRPFSPRTGSSVSSCFWARWWIGSCEKRDGGRGTREGYTEPQALGFTLPPSLVPRPEGSAPASETLPNGEPQRALRGGLVSQADEIEQEGVFKRDIPPPFVASRRAAVPRFHVRPQDQPVGAGFHRPQLGGPLRRLDIQHLRIVQAGGDEQIRIRLLLDVVIR